MQWGFCRIMERNLTLSQGDAGEPMERSGGALRRHIWSLNTVSGICTEAKTVQESMWNLNLLLSPYQVDYLLLVHKNHLFGAM